MVTFAESLCLLVWLKLWSVRGAYHHSALWATARLLVTRVSLTYVIDEFFFLLLLQMSKMRTLGESKVLSFCFWCEGGQNFKNFLVLPQGSRSFPTVFSRASDII